VTIATRPSKRPGVVEVLINPIIASTICDNRTVTSEATPSGGRTTGSLVLLVAASLIFSTGGMFVRSVHTDNAWTIVFWRSLSACVSIVVFMLISDRRGAVASLRARGVPGRLGGASFCVSSISMVAALSHTSVAVTLVILALTPLAAALLARVFIGETVHGYTWAAVAATVAGVAYMVSGPGANVNAVGVMIALLIPVTFGVGIIVIRKHPGIGMVPAMLLACAMSTAIALPLGKPFEVDRHDLLLLCLFGFGQLGFGLAIFAVGAKGAPATEAALLSMLEPVLGPIWVWIFKDEYPGVAGLIGGGIVFVALAVHTVYAAHRQTTVLEESMPAIG